MIDVEFIISCPMLGQSFLRIPRMFGILIHRRPCNLDLRHLAPDLIRKMSVVPVGLKKSRLFYSPRRRRFERDVAKALEYKEVSTEIPGLY